MYSFRTVLISEKSFKTETSVSAESVKIEASKDLKIRLYSQEKEESVRIKTLILSEIHFL